MFFSHCFSVFVHPAVPSALWSDWRQNAASPALTEAWPTLPSFLKHWGQKKIYTQLIFSAHVYFQYTHTKPWKIITEYPKTRSDRPLPTLLWWTSGTHLTLMDLRHPPYSDGPQAPTLLWWTSGLFWQTKSATAPYNLPLITGIRNEIWLILSNMTQFLKLTLKAAMKGNKFTPFQDFIRNLRE